MQHKRTRRPVMFALLGLLMCAVAGYLVYDHGQPRDVAPVTQQYTYRVQQAASSSAHYTHNKFFDGDGSPGADNIAYVTSLTDYLNSSLNYHFTGSAVTDLAYSYKADAVVHSTYNVKGSTDNAANVWTKTYPLLTPVTGKRTTKVLALQPNVTIPFAQYEAAANQFRTAYNLPVSSEVDVIYTVRVSGKMYGVPFTNTQTSTIIAPLDEQLFKIAVKLTKTDAQTVAAKRTWQPQDMIARYELLVATVLALLGLGAIVYGFRKQIIKSPYQRELARIYRYNDGIIVRARRPVALDHKTVVELDSFDDLLSIEEEAGTPIVANELGDTATRFMITNDDTAYVYTLGGTTSRDHWEASLAESSPRPSSTHRS